MLLCKLTQLSLVSSRATSAATDTPAANFSFAAVNACNCNAPDFKDAHTKVASNDKLKMLIKSR